MSAMTEHSQDQSNEGDESTAPGDANSPNGYHTSPSDADEKPIPSVSETQAESQPEASPEKTKTETFLIMMALCMSLFLAALDSTIVTTCIPTITAHFNSSSGYVWIGSAYLLGTAAFVPLWGEISNIFGRKPVLLVAVCIFVLGSLFCGVSQSMGMLVAARAIQGIGSGGAGVLPNLCISDLFSLRTRSMYFGILGMVWAFSSALGPVLGGIFASKASWRWAFYINMPVGGFSLAILVWFLRLHNPRTPLRQGLAAIDWVGNILVVGATLMFLLGLEFGGVKYYWKSATVIGLIIAGTVALAIFIIYEARLAKYPVIPSRIFHRSTSIAAFSLSFVHAIAFLGGAYWLPLYFQSVLGATPLLSGVYLLPFVFSLSVCSALNGYLIKQTGNYKVPITGGFFIATLGYGFFIYLGDLAHWARIILVQIVAGIGIGPNFQAALVALQSNIEQHDIGAATTSFAFLRQIGNSVSVVIGGVVFNNIMNEQNSKLPVDIAAMFDGSHAAANAEKTRFLPNDERGLVQATYWYALQRMFIMYTCFCFAGLLISLLVKHKDLSAQHTEYKTGLANLKATNREKRVDVDCQEELNLHSAASALGKGRSSDR